MKDGIFIFEQEADQAYGEFFKIENIVYKERSEFQEILIYDNRSTKLTEIYPKR